MEIFTIGFTQTTAEDFVGRLKSHRIERLLDVRLSNTSQLAGFAKRDDLTYFLRELVAAEYEHAPLLAPSAEIFDAYKKRGKMPWREFEERFLGLMRERSIETELKPEQFERRTVLLCSEPTRYSFSPTQGNGVADAWPGSRPATVVGCGRCRITRTVRSSPVITGSTDETWGPLTW